MILGALAQAIPERVMACSNSACIVAYFIGKRPLDGSTWVYLETIGGGSGARATKDGLDGVHVHTTNTSNLPVEALEIEYPLTLMRYELVEDSGGVGQYRGGMGLRRVYQATHECRVRVDITDGVFHVDFTGTARAARGNVNCPLAVARSAVLFVVRTLLPEDVPTNGGLQRAVRVTAPVGCLVKDTNRPDRRALQPVAG